MLTLTMDASTAVTSIVGRATDASVGGLRIADDGTEAHGLALSVTPAPEASDTIVENEGARVFLDAQAAEALDDKILDAAVDDTGALRFALAPQH